MTAILFIQTQPPHGKINGQEGLDALLMGSAFTDCGALFVADGVLQLVKGQAPEALGSRDYARGFGALADYGVTKVYCCQTALAKHRLKADDLLLPVELVDSGQTRQLLAQYDRVLTF